jgi:hypothetical protein
MIAVGYLDVARADQVAGWCWFPDAPEARVVVEILFDNDVVATTVAGIYRDDLALVGIGDGWYGFSARLDVLPSHFETFMVSVRVQATGQAVGQARRVGVLLDHPLSRHITQIESDFVTLVPEIRRVSHRAHSLSGENQSRGTLHALADFLIAAANNDTGNQDPRCQASATASGDGILLRAALRGLRRLADYSRTQFMLVAQPRVSIVLFASSIETTVIDVALAASVAARISAEVIILDDKPEALVALLPAVFPGLRYHSVSETGLAAALGVGAMVAQGDVILFLNSGLRIGAGVMDNIQRAFDENERLGLISIREIDNGGGCSLCRGCRCFQGERDSRVPCAEQNDRSVESISFAARRLCLREASVTELGRSTQRSEVWPQLSQRLMLLGYASLSA